MASAAQVQVQRAGDDHLLMRLAGPWLARDGLPEAPELSPPVRRIAFDTRTCCFWKMSPNPSSLKSYSKLWHYSLARKFPSMNSAA